MEKKTKQPNSLPEFPASVIDQVNRLEIMRRDFVANVSHELRTPLTVIRGYLEALVDKTEYNFDELQKIFYQMQQHCLRMENLVEDLLLLSRLENAEQPPDKSRKVAVSSLLTNLCEDAKKISGAANHQIILQADNNLMLRGDQQELKSLFGNVIVNAVKYTPDNGKIAVAWFLNDHQQAVFSVQDTGIGIAEKHIPRITERFYRVDKARSRQSGGTGLGLAIVKHVLLRHEGELSIKSKPGKGSTFIFTFPGKISIVVN